MQSDPVTYEFDDGVALIGLNRQDKRNAFNRAMTRQFHDAVARAGKEAKVGIIFAHGDHFSAGLDLAEARELMAAGEWNRAPLHVDQPPAFEALARGPIPFVTALQGAVIGGGLELAAAAHIRIADETAFFALPEGQHGIFVGGGGSVRIARIIGYSGVVDMMLTGRVLSAADATRLHLVQYSVRKGEALTKAKELAHRIKTNAVVSNFAITNALSRIQDLSYEDGLFFERVVTGLAAASGDAELRMQAFVDKSRDRIRPPGPEHESKIG